MEIFIGLVYLIIIYALVILNISYIILGFINLLKSDYKDKDENNKNNNKKIGKTFFKALGFNVLSIFCYALQRGLYTVNVTPLDGTTSMGVTYNPTEGEIIFARLLFIFFSILVILEIIAVILYLVSSISYIKENDEEKVIKKKRNVKKLFVSIIFLIVVYGIINIISFL